jgi:putative redox protein
MKMERFDTLGLKPGAGTAKPQRAKTAYVFGVVVRPRIESIFQGANIDMVEIKSTYVGGLRCESIHCPSGNTLLTDAPVDNHGKGETFSPSDLVATALGNCMMTVMGIVAQRNNIPYEGVKATVLKEMTSGPPRRIARLSVRLDMPAGLSPEQRQKLENTAHACPVHKSLHPEVEVPLEFVYPDE